MKRTAAIITFLTVALCAAAQVYVVTDKQCYIAGDMVWCSAFCVDSNAVAYLELQSPEGRVQTSKIALDKGRGAGCFRIPLDVPTGNYRLTAYTDCARLVDGYDFNSGSRVLSIYNTLSGERRDGGVELVKTAPANLPVPVYAGLSIEVGDSIRVKNTSGERVSFCLSAYRLDSLEPSSHSSIALFSPARLDVPSREWTGEIIRGTLSGKDVDKFTDRPGSVAFISVPGDKYCIYTSYVSPDGTVTFNTDNIYGDRDLVCQLDGADESVDCHFSPDSPFVATLPGKLPALPLSSGMAGDLIRRTAAMQAGRQAVADTLFESLPMHREHLLLSKECKTYVLDDYTRFPTMQELFVEIVTDMHVRRKGGHAHISVLLYDPDNRRVMPVWGDALMLIDGVPVFNHDLFMSYDPALVKQVEVYPTRYSFGDKVYEGVANFVTFKGNMPLIAFNDNLRIYDFKGTAVPMSCRGAETLLWEPLLTLGADEEIVFPCSGMQAGASYGVVAEGLSGGGRAVYARKIVR